MSSQVFAFRTQMIDQQLADEAARNVQRANLSLEKLRLEIDDGQWAQWYDFYHQILCVKEKQDVEWYVHRRLSYNLEAAAIYILISAIFITQLRHWWWMTPSFMWVLILIAFEYSSVQRWRNKWSTLLDQIRYLSDKDAGANEAA